MLPLYEKQERYLEIPYVDNGGAGGGGQDQRNKTSEGMITKLAM